MRAVCIAVALLWTAPAFAQTPDHLLPSARVEVEKPLAPWAAALVPGLLTLGGIAAAATIPNNEVGFWVAGASLWIMPSVGNIALGNYRMAGAWWALRTMGVAMMIPAALIFRGHSTPARRGTVYAYGVFGALCLVAGFVIDIISAHHYAGELQTKKLSIGPGAIAVRF